MKFAFDSITDFIFVKSEIQPADIILVPGGSSPQPMEAAAKLYQDGLAPYILPSGRYNTDLSSFPSEWEFLRQIALAQGVPDIAILKEDQAANTFENAKFSLKRIYEKELKVQKAILVCKAFHSRRALLTYQTIFPGNIEFFVHPVTDNSGITRDNWHLNQQMVQTVLGEVEKIGKYFVTEIDKLVEKPI
ncbi:MAG: YdcF family protein [Clostridia bacterium]|nr:YdcF family protein [Clostridia bacterium]